MSKNQPVESPDAPRAIGPYSQAIECRPDRMLFLSGQIALDPATGTLVPGGIEAETRQVLANLQAVLVAGGMDRWNVVKTTIFLVDMQDFVRGVLRRPSAGPGHRAGGRTAPGSPGGDRGRRGRLRSREDPRPPVLSGRIRP